MPRELQAIAVVLLLVVLGWFGYGLLFDDSGDNRLTVTAVTGEVRHVDGFGAAKPAEAGQTLAPRDRIVAGAGGRAVLALGPDSRVTVEEKSAVRVVSLDQAGVKLELEGGRVQATVRPGAGSVGITADGQTVTGADADFQAVRGEDGTLAVVSSRGGLDVEGVEDTTRLGEGQRLVSAPGGSALVAPASEDLLLQVAWPEAPRTREAVAEVHGHTEPGATVRVGHEGAWVEVKADKSGDFVARAPLTEGANDLRVEATSVLGTTAAVAHAVVRDTIAPNVSIGITY